MAFFPFIVFWSLPFSSCVVKCVWRANSSLKSSLQRTVSKSEEHFSSHQVMMALSAHLGSLEAEKQKLRAQVRKINCLRENESHSNHPPSPSSLHDSTSMLSPSLSPSLLPCLELSLLLLLRCVASVRRTSGWGMNWLELSRGCRTESRRWSPWRSRTDTCSSCPPYANMTRRSHSWWGQRRLGLFRKLSLVYQGSNVEKQLGNMSRILLFI